MLKAFGVILPSLIHAFQKRGWAIILSLIFMLQKFTSCCSFELYFTVLGVHGKMYTNSRARDETFSGLFKHCVP